LKALTNNYEIDIKGFFNILSKHKIMIFIFTVFFTLSAILYAYLSTNIYSAVTTVKLNIKKTMPVNQEDVISSAMVTDNINIDTKNTELEIIQSRTVVEKALQGLAYTHKYFETYRFKEKELYQTSPFSVELYRGENLSFYITPVDELSYKFEVEGIDKQTSKAWTHEKIVHYGSRIKSDYYDFTLTLNKGYILDKGKEYRFIVCSSEKAIENVRNNLFVYFTKNNSSIVAIEIYDNIPQRASLYSNAISNAYLTQAIQRRKKEEHKVLDFIDKQLDSVNKQLESSANKLEVFKKSSKMLKLENKGDDIREKLNEYNNLLSDAEIQENGLIALSRQIETSKNFKSISLEGLGLDLSNSTIPELIRKLQDEQLIYEKMLSDYTYKHSKVKKIARTIEQLKEVIASTIWTLKEHTSKRKLMLKEKILQYNAIMVSLPEKEKIYGSLERRFIINEKIFSYMLEKRASTAINKASSINKNYIVDKAIIPEIPIKPNRKMIIFLAFIASLIFSSLIALLREFMNNTIITKDDVEKNTILPIIGSIPKVKNINQELQVLENPHSAISESYRTLRSNLQFFTQKNKKNMTISITSTISGEGKSTLAVNLASIIALTDKKVVVVDLDMRKPTMHNLFKLTNQYGMSTLLTGNSSLDDVMQYTIYGNLSVITSGPIPPNPSELLASKEIYNVIDKLQEIYDVVILDTPPIGLVTDTMHLIKISDVTLYLVRSKYSKKSYLYDLEAMIKQYKLKGLSLVLYGVKTSKDGYGYYE